MCNQLNVHKQPLRLCMLQRSKIIYIMQLKLKTTEQHEYAKLALATVHEHIHMSSLKFSLQRIELSSILLQLKEYVFMFNFNVKKNPLSTCFMHK